MENNCIYYRIDVSKGESYKRDFSVSEDFIVKVRRPVSFSFHDIVWNIFSLGRFKEYQLIDKRNGVVTSTAQVIPKIFIFQFMSSHKSIHIGPCSTKKEYRGNGFYPFLLSRIIDDYKNGIDKFYIFCDKTNNSSIRGIEKVGFKRFGEGYQNKYGVYLLDTLY